MPFPRRGLAVLALLAACRPAPSTESLPQSAGPAGGGLGAAPAAAAGLAPAFSLKDLDGKTVSLSDFRGKPVFIDFWATWCPPCRASMPEVEKLRVEMGPDLVVLGLNLDDDEGAVRSFVKKKGVNYPVLFAAGTDVSDRYNVQGIPFFALVDKDGRLAHAWEGYAGGFPAEWRRAVKRLLTPSGA